MVIVVLDTGGREITVESLKILVGRARPTVQEQEFGSGVVAHTLSPDAKLSLRSVHRNQPHAAAEHIASIGVVQIGRCIGRWRDGFFQMDLQFARFSA